ncbi:MAG TPA: hypothetical protein VFX84_00085, partial [Candidatus Saccharimonadales bacterium]|nr:hypothetical protein [Candidatus Saccharimonadales bacterium]
FGLGQMEETLDHIAVKAAEIQALDTTIARAHVTDKIITPPGQANPLEVRDGSHYFEGADKMPRLKTLLFVLANDFGVDVNDRNQLNIIKGSVANNMVRQDGYYLVDVPALGRLILVCDEHANATFVFDSGELEQREIVTEELVQISKDELRDFLDDNPHAGQRISYSRNFVPDIISAIAVPATSDSPRNTDTTQSGGRYLAPKAPEDVVSLYGLVKLMDVNSSAVEQAIQDLEDDLGELHAYRFGSVATIGYTPEHQERIRQRLEEQGYYEEPPEGYLHQWGIAKVLGVDPGVVQRAIARLGDDLGSAQKYKSARRRTSHYSIDQQRIIREDLENRGIFNEPVPEDYLSARDIAEHYGVSPATVAKVIDEVMEDLGETRIYRFGAKATTGYSPSQQTVIADRLEKGGALTQPAPAGYASISGIAKALGLGHPAINRAIGELVEDLGETQTYKFTTRNATGYSPEQQNLIAAQLDAESLLDNDPPEGYKAVGAIARELVVADRTVSKAVNRLKDSLGETRKYKFGTRIVNGYSPHQQEVLAQDIIERSLIESD